MDESGVFVKRSDDPRAGAALRAEGEMLRAAAHPGVVELIRSEAVGDGWELVLRRVDGSNLDLQAPWPARELAGFGSAVATTLADLHDLGIVHGRLVPGHVLVDGSGRPLLCGFGQARRCLGDPAAGGRKAADVADLARSLAARLPADAPRSLRRALERGMAGRRGGDPSAARQLARALGQSVPGAVLPAPPPRQVPEGTERGGPVPPRIPEAAAGTAGEPGHGEEDAFDAEPGSARPGPRSARRPARRPVVVGGVLLLVVLACSVAAGLVFFPTSSPGSKGSASAASSPPARQVSDGIRCPAVDDRCRPVAHPGGVLTLGRARYRIGEPRDVLVLGRWTCAAQAFPVLLRPANGQVWVFGRWAEPGRETTAALLRRVAGARSLRVLPGVDGCDRVEVLRRNGPPVIVAPPRQPSGGVGAIVGDRSHP